MAESPQRPSDSHADGADAASDRGDERGPVADSTEEAVARGRASETPFVLLGGVAAVIWAVVGLVAAAVLLLWWLG